MDGAILTAAELRKEAKKDGWVRTRQGFDLCPLCCPTLSLVPLDVLEHGLVKKLSLASLHPPATASKRFVRELALRATFAI